MAQLSSSFAKVLATALGDSSLPVAAIAAELADRGYPVDAKTLSAWQRGNTLPLHKAWKPAIAELDNILGLPEGALDNALRDDLQSARNSAAVIPFLPFNSVDPSTQSSQASRHFHELDKEISWDNEAVRKTMSEKIILSEDLCSAEYRISLVVQLPAVHKPTVHLSTHYLKDLMPAEGDIGVYDVEGATIGATIEKDLGDAISRTTTLELPPGIPGQMRQVSYAHHFVFPKPVTFTVDRVFSWPLLYYTCDVTFLGSVPDAPRWEVMRETQADLDSPEPLFSRPLMPVGNTLSVVLENPCNMWAVIRWDSESDT